LTSRNILIVISGYSERKNLRFLNTLMSVGFNTFLRKKNLVHSYSIVVRFFLFRHFLFFRLNTSLFICFLLILFAILIILFLLFRLLKFVINLEFLQLKPSNFLLKEHHCLVTLLRKELRILANMQRTRSTKLYAHQTILIINVVNILRINYDRCLYQ